MHILVAAFYMSLTILLHVQEDEGGVVAAMHNLGVCYDNGFGVDRDDVLACT